MSVINQMLRDLDAREASQQERAGLPPRLRTLPPNPIGKQASWYSLAIGMGVGALVAGIAVALLMRSPQPTATAPSEMQPPPAVSAPVSPAISAPTTNSATNSSSGRMKLDTQLASTSKVAKPAPAPTGPVEAKPISEPQASTAAVASPKPKPAAAQKPESRADEAQIDKRPQGGQGKTLAEDEYRKGMQAVKRGDAATAESIFRHALELDPAMAKARQALLSVLVGGRRWNEAQQIAQEGLAIDPVQTGWATILARLQFEQGDAAAAVETLQRHAAHAGSDADYQGLFAYLLQKQQRPAEAADRFKAALGLRPNEGRWWFGLGLALEGAGKAAEAREAFGKAREIGNLPNDMQAVLEQKLR